MMVYICTKSHENILNGIRVMERTRKVNGRTNRRTARQNTTRLRRAYNKYSEQLVSKAGGHNAKKSHTRQIDTIDNTAMKRARKKNKEEQMRVEKIEVPPWDGQR